MTNAYLAAAGRLHDYLIARHLREGALIGPDPGARWNYHVFRFIKGYLPFLPWDDDQYYLQGQGYWVLGNWKMYELTGDEKYKALAIQSSERMLSEQREDGAWEHPMAEWKGRVATFDGNWAAIGLTDSYRHTGEERFINGAMKWREFLRENISFQQVGDQLSVNYFADSVGPMIPNVSISLLHLLVELAEATGDESHLELAPGLLAFIKDVQRDNGEFPYAVVGPKGGPERIHNQCYQYNAFEGINLIRYMNVTGDESIRPTIERLYEYLSGGLGSDGHALYECENPYRAVTYHAGAMGAFFVEAAKLGFEGAEALADMAYSYVVGKQRKGGGFPHSRGDWYVLQDTRSYPRYQAMILYHLLVGAEYRLGQSTPDE